MTTPTFTTPPPAPSRQNPSTFSARTDAFLAYLEALSGELTAFVLWLTGKSAQVASDADRAALAASSAVSAAGATAWVSGADYTAGDAVFSPVDQLTYRARADITNSTLDPSTDGANWTNIVTAGVDAAETRARHFALIAAANL